MGSRLEAARSCVCCAVLRQAAVVENAVQGAVSSGFPAVADWGGVTYLPICCLLAPLDCWKSGHGIFTWRACQKDLE